MAATAASVVGAGVSLYGAVKGADAGGGGKGKGEPLTVPGIQAPGGGGASLLTEENVADNFRKDSRAYNEERRLLTEQVDRASPEDRPALLEQLNALKPPVKGTVGDINIDAGDLEAPRAGLVDLAGNQVAKAAAGGEVPAAVQAAADRASGLNATNFDDTSLEQLGVLEAGTNQTLSDTGGQFGDRLAEGFNEGFQQNAFDAAGNQLNLANQSPQGATDAALANFRAQALPENQRAVNNLTSDLFSGGRLGTTGGAGQVGRLAEAQNLQDLQFQSAANQEGRDTVNNAANLSKIFQSAGDTNAITGDNLLNASFNRFDKTAQFAEGLNTERFNRTLKADSVNKTAAQTELQNQVALETLPGELQRADLDLGLAALKGQAGIQEQGLDLFDASLRTGIAQSNAINQTGSNVSAGGGGPDFGSMLANTVGAGLQNNAGAIGDFFTSEPSGVVTGNAGQQGPPVPSISG